MHGDLKAAEPLAFGPAASPTDLLREIGRIRELVAEAGRRLDAIAASASSSNPRIKARESDLRKVITAPP